MEKLLLIINSVLENEDKDLILELTPEMDIRNDIGLTSFDLAELTVKLESEFNVDIFEDGLVFTIGEIIDKLKI